MAGAGGARDAAVAADFAVGAGADTDVVAELPVVEVVAALLAVFGEGAGFVAFEAGIKQGVVHGLFDGVGGVFFGDAGGRGAAEGGVGLHGEVVGADVGYAEGEGGFGVAPGFFGGLVRQGIHEVGVHAGEDGERGFDGGAGFVAVVDAAEGVQFGVVETLDAERQAGDAGFGVALEAGLFESAGVGFEGDFGFGLQAHQGAHAAEQAVNGFGGKHAGGTAADEDGVHQPSPDMGQFVLQVGEQGVDVGGFVGIGLEAVGVEVAIGAFLNAPGNVDIERERGQGT